MSDQNAAPSGHLNLQQIADGQTEPAGKPTRAPRLVGPAFSWGLHLIVMVLTATYLAIEWRYNIRLMQMMADPDLPHDAVEHYAMLGRALGAFGLTWALLRPIACLMRGAAMQLLVFCGMLIGVFFGLTVVFDTIVERVDEPDDKRAAMAASQYRHDLLAGRAADDALPGPADEPYLGPVMMADWPLIAWDEDWTVESIARMEQRAAEEVADLRRAAAEHFPQYQRVHQTIDEMYRNYVDGAALVQSRSYHHRSVSAFRMRTGGMSPRANMSRESFVRHQIPRSSLPEAKQVHNALEQIIMIDALGREFRLGHVPPRMDRREYEQWVEAKAEDIIFRISPAVDRIDEHDDIDDVVAAIALPPAMMTLSVLALVLNAAALLVQALTLGVGLLASRWWKVVGLTTGIALPIGAIFGVGHAVGPTAFNDHSRVREAEQRMADDLGVAGDVWARAGAVQRSLNARSERPARAVDAFFEWIDARATAR